MCRELSRTPSKHCADDPRPPAHATGPRAAPAPDPTADQATKDAMSSPTNVSPAHSASTASTLITNIAALVTNDPSLGDGSPSD